MLVFGASSGHILEALTPLEMTRPIRLKITLVAPMSHPPATEPFPADKKSDRPLDSGSIVDSDGGSTSGKWPNKAFALFRLLLALPGPMF